MNQRIFEIIQELNGRAGLDWNEEDKAEFVELIVRECMRKTAGYLHEDEFGDSDVKEASEELAKHFGVE